MAYPYQPPLPQQLPVPMMNSPLSALTSRPVTYSRPQSSGAYHDLALRLAGAAPQPTQRTPSALSPLRPVPPSGGTGGGGAGGIDLGSVLGSAQQLGDLSDLGGGLLGGTTAAEELAAAGAADTSQTNQWAENELSNMSPPNYGAIAGGIGAGAGLLGAGASGAVPSVVISDVLAGGALAPAASVGAAGAGTAAGTAGAAGGGASAGAAGSGAAGASGGSSLAGLGTAAAGAAGIALAAYGAFEMLNGSDDFTQITRPENVTGDVRINDTLRGAQFGSVVIPMGDKSLGTFYVVGADGSMIPIKSNLDRGPRSRAAASAAYRRAGGQNALGISESQFLSDYQTAINSIDW